MNRASNQAGCQTSTQAAGQEKKKNRRRKKKWRLVSPAAKRCEGWIKPRRGFDWLADCEWWLIAVTRFWSVLLLPNLLGLPVEPSHLDFFFFFSSPAARIGDACPDSAQRLAAHCTTRPISRPGFHSRLELFVTWYNVCQSSAQEGTRKEISAFCICFAVISSRFLRSLSSSLDALAVPFPGRFW